MENNLLNEITRIYEIMGISVDKQILTESVISSFFTKFLKSLEKENLELLYNKLKADLPENQLKPVNPLSRDAEILYSDAISDYVSRTNEPGMKYVMTLLIRNNIIEIDDIVDPIIERIPNLVDDITKKISGAGSEDEAYNIIKKLYADKTSTGQYGPLSILDDNVLKRLSQKIYTKSAQAAGGLMVRDIASKIFISPLIRKITDKRLLEIVRSHFPELPTTNFLGITKTDFFKVYARKTYEILGENPNMNYTEFVDKVDVMLAKESKKYLEAIQRKGIIIDAKTENILKSMDLVIESGKRGLGSAKGIYDGIMDSGAKTAVTAQEGFKAIRIGTEVVFIPINTITQMRFGGFLTLVVVAIIATIVLAKKRLPQKVQDVLNGITPNVETTEKVDFNNVPKELTGFLFTTWHGLDNTFNKESLSKFSYYKIGDNNWKIVVGKDKNGGDLYYLVEYNPETKQYKIQDAK